MKKKFILIAVAVLLLTGCSKDKILKCSAEDFELGEGIKINGEATYRFDSKTEKFKNQDLEIILKFDNEEDVEKFINNKDSFCEVFTTDLKKCKTTQKEKNITVNIEEINNPNLEEMNIEAAKKYLEEKGNKCS